MNEPRLRFKGFADEWQEVDLGQAFDVITDYVSNGSFESLRNNVKAYDDPNYAYLIRLQDYSNDWKGPWRYTDKKGYEYLKKSKIEMGDIIMSNVGNSLSTTFRAPKMDKPMTLAPNTVLMKSSKNDTSFLFYLLINKKVNDDILRMSTTGAQPKINKTDLKKIKVYLPDLDEQKKIGSFFSDIDNQIKLQSDKLETLKRDKKGYLQKMFPIDDSNKPKLRLKGFSDDWNIYSLDKLVNKFDENRIPVKESDRKKGDVPYYGANGIQDYVKGYTHNGEYVLIAEDGANSVNDYPIYKVNGKIWVNNHAHVLQGKERITNTLFISYLLKDLNLRPYLTGGSRYKLNASAMMKIKIKMPSYEEQKMIGMFLSNLDKQIELQQNKLIDLKNQKKAYLQKMFI